MTLSTPAALKAAARFEAFAKMRLSGRNDVIYRNYDLLTPNRLAVNVKRYLDAAGQYMPDGSVIEPLTVLQRRFMEWGYGVKTLNEIETLLHEFWVYQRIGFYGKKNWPFRDPDETQRLFLEDQAARAGE